MVNLPPEGRVDSFSAVVPPVYARMSPGSHPVVSLDQSADSSVATSPNHVRLDNSQDVLDVEPVFEVSPDTSGFLTRPSWSCCAGTGKLSTFSAGLGFLLCPGARGTGSLYPQ